MEIPLVIIHQNLRRVTDVEWTRKHGNANVMHFEHFKTGLLAGV